MKIVNPLDLTSGQFMSMMNMISSVEKEVYPSYMLSMQGVTSERGFKNYCESNSLQVIFSEDMYCICSKTEVIDFATTGKLSLVELQEVKNFLKSWFKNKSFSLDARATTSYRLIKFLEHKKEINIISQEMWYWNNEQFYDLELQFN